MGMSASAELWYGAWTQVISEAALTEMEEPADGGYEKVIDGIHITPIYVYDRLIGAGGVIAEADWGENSESIDLGDRLAKIKAAVDKFLDEYDVPGKRGIYLSADYS
jgi:hypothetical protein